jgi:hypothetical protein
MLTPRMGERSADDASRPPSGGSWRWLLAAGAAACLLYFASEAWLLGFDLGFPLDDSWIHLQFARNLAAGQGLSYNPGELVTGSTAPLWTALVSLLFLLPGSVLVWVKLLGSALYLAMVGGTYRLAGELGLGQALASLAAGLTLATSWMVWSALSGMEIPLFTALSIWGIAWHLRERGHPERPPLAAGVLALAALARPEGLLLFALALADRCLIAVREGAPGDAGTLRLLRPRLAPVAAAVGLAACALAGPLLFYRWAGGSFLPTTFAAKGGELRRWVPSLQYLHAILPVFMRPQPFMTFLFGAGVLAQIERLGTPHDRGLLPSLWLLGLPLAYSVLSPEKSLLLAGNFGRYLFPLLPLLVVLGTLGLERAAGALGPWVLAGRLRLPLRAALAVVLLAPTLYNLAGGALFYATNVANVQDSDVHAARWLARRLPAGALLAVNDIGALKYFLPNRIVDLAGIANPELRREVEAAMAAGVRWGEAMKEAIARRRPDYVVIFPAWLPALRDDPRFRAVYRLKLRDNKTMGGAELVVYRTPWARYPLREVP